MANFQRAIEWLESGGKVRRPSWGKDSYWKLGVDEAIQWIDGAQAHIHLNQIKATDWEIYEEKPIKEIIEEIRKDPKAMKQVRELLKEDELDFCLTDKIIKTKEITKENPHEDLFNFGWIHDEDAKECFKQIKFDLIQFQNHEAICRIIDKRAGPKLT